MKILRSVLGSCLALLITTQTALSMQKPLQGTKLNVVEGALRNKLSQNIANMDAQQYWKWSQDIYSNFNQLPSSLQNTYKKKIRDKKYSLSDQTIRNLLQYWFTELQMRGMVGGQLSPQALVILQDAADFIGNDRAVRYPEYINFIATIAALNDALRTRADSNTYTAFKNVIGEQNLRDIITFARGMQPITPAPTQQSMTPEQRLTQSQDLLNRIINHFAQQFADWNEVNDGARAMRNLVNALVPQIQAAYITSRSVPAIDAFRNRVRPIATDLAANLMNRYRENDRVVALIDALQYYFIVYLVGIVDEEFADELSDIFDTATESANNSENIVNDLLSTLNLPAQLQMELGLIGSMSGSIPAVGQAPTPAGSQLSSGWTTPSGSQTSEGSQLSSGWATPYGSQTSEGSSASSSWSSSQPASSTPQGQTTAFLNSLLALPGDTLNTYVTRVIGIMNRQPLQSRALIPSGADYAGLTWQEMFNGLEQTSGSPEIYEADFTKVRTLNNANRAREIIATSQILPQLDKFLLVCYWIIQNEIWKEWNPGWANANLQPIVDQMRIAIGL